MSPKAVSALPLAILLHSALGAASSLGQDSVGQDSAPTFRFLLEAEEYGEWLAMYRHQIRTAESLAETAMPEVGVRVLDLVGGSIAERLAIPLDSIVASIGGVPLWGNIEWPERQEPAEAVIFTSKGEELRHTVPPGIIGVRKGNHFRPELALIRAHSNHRDSSWWPHALLGALAHGKDSSLSETAWAIAIGEGYPTDYISDFFAASLSIHRPSEREAAIERFLSRFRGSEPIPLWCQPEIAALLAALGRYRDLSRILAQNSGPHFWTDDEVARLAELGDETSHERLVGDPLEYINSRPFRILNSELEIDEYFHQGGTGGESVGFRLPVTNLLRGPGTYFSSSLRPPNTTPNLHARLDLRRLVPSGHHGTYDESLTLALVSRRDPPQTRFRGGRMPPKENILAGVTVNYQAFHPREGRTPLYYLSAGRNSGRWMAHSAGQRGPGNPLGGGPPSNFENLVIDLFQVGREAFLYLNGTPYARVPLATSEDDLCVVLFMVGMTANIGEYTIREYKP